MEIAKRASYVRMPFFSKYKTTIFTVRQGKVINWQIDKNGVKEMEVAEHLMNNVAIIYMGQIRETPIFSQQPLLFISKTLPHHRPSVSSGLQTYVVGVFNLA